MIIELDISVSNIKISLHHVSMKPQNVAREGRHQSWISGFHPCRYGHCPLDSVAHMPPRLGSAVCQRSYLNSVSKSTPIY